MKVPDRGSGSPRSSALRPPPSILSVDADLGGSWQKGSLHSALISRPAEPYFRNLMAELGWSSLPKAALTDRSLVPSILIHAWRGHRAARGLLPPRSDCQYGLA